MSEKDGSLDVECESCKNSLTEATILRHIGQTQACKAYYGARFYKMKTKKDTLRKEKYRKNMTNKAKRL